MEPIFFSYNCNKQKSEFQCFKQDTVLLALDKKPQVEQ